MIVSIFIAIIYAVFRIRGPATYGLAIPVAAAANSIGVAVCSQIFMLDLKGRIGMPKLLKSIHNNFVYHLAPLVLSILIMVLCTYCTVGKRATVISILAIVLWITVMMIWCSIPSKDKKHTFIRKFQSIYNQSDIIFPISGLVISVLFIIGVICPRLF